MTDYIDIPIDRYSGLMSPRLALLVTCCGVDGRPNVLSIGWHMPISRTPPLAGIAVSPARFSHALIAASGEFTINVVGQNFIEQVEICGTLSGADVADKFAEAGLQTAPGKTVKAPQIVGALGVIECHLYNQIEAGDHTLFIGEVSHASAQRPIAERNPEALLYLKSGLYGSFSADA